MALQDARRLSRLVLLNAVGVEREMGQTIVDPMALAPADRSALSFHGPDYGQNWVKRILRAVWSPIPEAGHFPQIEQLEVVTRLVRLASSTQAG